MRTSCGQAELARLWNHRLSHAIDEEPGDILYSLLCSSGNRDIRANDASTESQKQRMAYMEAASAGVKRGRSYQYGATTYRENSTEDPLKCPKLANKSSRGH